MKNARQANATNEIDHTTARVVLSVAVTRTPIHIHPINGPTETQRKQLFSIKTMSMAHRAQYMKEKKKTKHH